MRKDTVTNCIASPVTLGSRSRRAQTSSPVCCRRSTHLGRQSAVANESNYNVIGPARPSVLNRAVQYLSSWYSACTLQKLTWGLALILHYRRNPRWLNLSCRKRKEGYQSRTRKNHPLHTFLKTIFLANGTACKKVSSEYSDGVDILAKSPLDCWEEKPGPVEWIATYARQASSSSRK